jgi:hypothetical protein
MKAKTVIGNKAFQTETVEVTRRVTIQQTERVDLTTAVDTVLEQCAAQDCEVVHVAQRMAEAVGKLIDLSEEFTQLKEAVFGIWHQFREEYGGGDEASYLLREHADSLQDLNAELRGTARSLIGHLEALVETQR